MLQKRGLICQINKYAAKNYDSLRSIVPKGCKELIKAAATKKAKGSINGYVNQAINERLQKDGFSPMQKQIAEPDRTEQAVEPMQKQEKTAYNTDSEVFCYE